MALLQPATANYFGFLPYSANGIEAQVNAYPVSSSEGQIAAGDLCVLTSRNTVKSGSTATGTALAANVIGVDVGQIVKSLIFAVDGEVALHVVRVADNLGGGERGATLFQNELVARGGDLAEIVEDKLLLLAAGFAGGGRRRGLRGLG